MRAPKTLWCTRNSFVLNLVAVCLSVSTLFRGAAATEVDLQEEGRFVAKYCFACHGAQRQEADRRFDELMRPKGEAGAGEKTDDTAEAWQEILDRLNLGDMPPEDAELQPSDADRQRIVDQLTRKLAALNARSSEQTVLRRLNKYEYDAAVRHTLGLGPMLADPTADFTPDEKREHFENIGEHLVISDFLMTRYLDASDEYLQAAIDLAKQNASPRTLKFNAPFCRSMPNPDGQDRAGKYQHLRENPTDRYGYLWLSKLRRGVPAAGRYKIRVFASAINRQYEYDESIILASRNDPLRLGIVAGDTRAGDMATNNPTDRPLAEFDVPDGEPKWFETTAWLDKHYQPRFTYPNGPVRIKYMRHRLLKTHRDSFEKFIDNHVHVFATMHPDYDKETAPALERAFLDEQDRLKKAGKPYDVFGTAHRMHTDEAWIQFYNDYQGPRIRIYEVQLEGPLPDAEAPLATYFFPQKEIADSAASQLIRDFAIRAWRTEPSQPEIDVETFIGLYTKERRAEATQNDALKLAYQAILCSPRFLYHRTKSGKLSSIELANRLSFLLWNQPADKQLIEAAVKGELDTKAGLLRHADRLLSSSRSDRFITTLTNSWLQLTKLGTMLPDRTEHPSYYNERLESAMRTETRLYVADAIRSNRSVDVLIDSDYTFLNSSLARLYEIDGIEGHQFRRVQLDDRRRGGLLGHASILTATANGIDTSPVLRGVWVLESLLGTPPSPPPPDVEPLEPDTRGATTIREQLAKHRNVATCNNCHRLIDPPGFALESYDEIGRFRAYYEFGGWRRQRGADVDPSGQLSSGGRFRDVVELKQLLLQSRESVAKNFASKVLTLATGRLHDPRDRADITDIVGQVSPELPLRDLLHAVVQSPAMMR